MSERREDDYQSWYDEAIVAANEAGYGPCTAADAIRGLAEERDHYKKLAEEGTAPLIKSMKLEDGHFDMSITGPIVEAFAVALVGQFKEGGSVNYMEMNLYDRDEPFQRYTVTVQKVGAKSPADLVNEARAQVAAIEQLRPQWAQGYTSDSMAAQASTAALSQVWTLLGVDNQTDAMQKLRNIVEVAA
jgi:hypothetical protein